MKLIFVTFLLYFVAVNAIDIKEAAKKFHEEMTELLPKCKEEAKASDDDIEEIISYHIPPSSHEGKCILFCISKHFKNMNEDGTLNREGAIESLEHIKEADEGVYNKILEIYTKCGTSVELDSDPCVSASKLAECGLKEAKEMKLPEDFMEM